MIELTFTQYREKLSHEKKIRIPTEHIFENENLFLFFFKSREKWEYFTIVMKDNILEFDSIESFKINYCTNCLPVKDSPIWLPVPLDEVPEEAEIIGDIKETKKGIDILSGEEIVEAATSYSDFLERLFRLFEKKTLIAIDRINLQRAFLPHLSSKDANNKLNKNFGKFVSDLFNSVNTVSFSRKVKKYIKSDLEKGKGEAQTNTGTKISFSEAFDQKLNQLYQQQISGYTINGKKWFGIKGVTKEIQQQVIQTVQEGLNEDKSLPEIKESVRDTFGKFTENRSMLIARTETNRIVNEGTLLGYKETGIAGKKVWISAPFEKERSSPICQRLKGQIVDLDDDFIDPKTNQAFQSPPAHPNCRSRIAFRPE